MLSLVVSISDATTMTGLRTRATLKFSAESYSQPMVYPTLKSMGNQILKVIR
jgi:hypothetical protein